MEKIEKKKKSVFRPELASGLISKVYLAGSCLRHSERTGKREVKSLAMEPHPLFIISDTVIQGWTWALSRGRLRSGVAGCSGRTVCAPYTHGV